jgi:acyl carrier protein
VQLEELIAAIAKYLELDPGSVKPETTLGELGVDSLDLVTILEELSTTMNAFVEIDPDADRTVALADTSVERLATILVAHPD